MLSKILNESDLSSFKKLIDTSRKIVLTCHVKPDGDAVGSTLGFCNLLRGIGKEATVITPDQPPRSLDFMPGISDVVAYTRYPEYAERLMGDADIVVCCDFNTPSRQGALEKVTLSSSAPKILIDHHRDPDDFATLTFSEPEMSSTCELVFRIIAGLGLCGNLTREGATCLLTGLITDTRNFSVSCDNPEVYEVLMRLMEKGADKKMIVRKALETMSLDAFRLQAYAMTEKLEVFQRHHAAIITLSAEELSRYNYVKGDSEGLVNQPLKIMGVEYSIFLREDTDCIKVSARSLDNFPVSQICKDLFNGGGHTQAAGGEFYGTLEECRQKLVEALPSYDRYMPHKAEKFY